MCAFLCGSIKIERREGKEVERMLNTAKVHKKGLLLPIICVLLILKTLSMEAFAGPASARNDISIKAGSQTGIGSGSIIGIGSGNNTDKGSENQTVNGGNALPYTGTPFVTINNNIPYFKASDSSLVPFEWYSDLDYLGRCGPAFVNACRDIMPTESRGDIGMVKPTGWNQAKYEGIIESDPPYLYNRCHLIGFQISAENANERNLITGTRYMNVEGMLPFENRVADFVRQTNGHVLYRVTPVFEGSNLLASGVLIEARSVEGQGKGLSFCVYCFNVQPGIKIDHMDGSSSIEKGTADKAAAVTEAIKNKAPPGNVAKYIGNRNSKTFHYSYCTGAGDIKEKNKVQFLTRKEAIKQGYTPCQMCKP